MLIALRESCKNLFFPPRCAGCAGPVPFRHRPVFCGTCQSRIEFVAPPLCLCCGRPFDLGENRLCGGCLTKPPAFTLARSLAMYRKPLAQLITSLKFCGDPTPLAALARLMENFAGFQGMAEPDLIVPVPLHATRLRERGFNQAILLARACFPAWRAKIACGALERRRATLPQMGLSGIERRSNVKGAFRVPRPEAVAGRRVLLVDDVFTTGGTVNECATALRASGAVEVGVFTVARATPC